MPEPARFKKRPGRHTYVHMSKHYEVYWKIPKNKQCKQRCNFKISFIHPIFDLNVCLLTTNVVAAWSSQTAAAEQPTWSFRGCPLATACDTVIYLMWTWWPWLWAFGHKMYCDSHFPWTARALNLNCLRHLMLMAAISWPWPRTPVSVTCSYHTACYCTMAAAACPSESEIWWNESAFCGIPRHAAVSVTVVRIPQLGVKFHRPRIIVDLGNKHGIG